MSQVVDCSTWCDDRDGRPRPIGRSFHTRPQSVVNKTRAKTLGRSGRLHSRAKNCPSCVFSFHHLFHSLFLSLSHFVSFSFERVAMLLRCATCRQANIAVSQVITRVGTRSVIISRRGRAEKDGRAKCWTLVSRIHVAERQPKRGRGVIHARSLEAEPRRATSRKCAAHVCAGPPIRQILILLIGLFAPTRCSNSPECAQLKKRRRAGRSVDVTVRGILFRRYRRPRRLYTRLCPSHSHSRAWTASILLN